MKKLLSGIAALAIVSGLAFTATSANAAMSGSMMMKKPTCKAGDPLVWVTGSKVMYMKGDKYYGKTKTGMYACKSRAMTMGAHMSKMSGGSMMMGHGAMKGDMGSGSMKSGGSMGSGSMSGGSMSGGSMGSGSMSGNGAMGGAKVNTPGGSTPTTMPVAPGPGNVGGAGAANGNVPNNPGATPAPTTSPK